MSSIKLESNASGTGIFTIASPNSNTNRTLTLPDATGTIITTAGGAAISGTTGAFTTTVGVGGATPAASGAGITFPATESASSDANTLDDYEEGTCTPTLFGASSAGTTTYVSQTGNYTKIGRQVTVQVLLNVSAATGTGEVRIGGLPFTVGVNGYVVPMVNALNWGGGTYLALSTISASTNMELYYCADDAVRTNQQMVNELQAYFFTLTYFV